MGSVVRGKDWGYTLVRRMATLTKLMALPEQFWVCMGLLIGSPLTRYHLKNNVARVHRDDQHGIRFVMKLLFFCSSKLQIQIQVFFQLKFIIPPQDITCETNVSMHTLLLSYMTT